MAHMQRTFFCFITEFNGVVFLSSSILLIILVPHFEIVELDGSFYPRFRKGVV